MTQKISQRPTKLTIQQVANVWAVNEVGVRKTSVSLAAGGVVKGILKARDTRLYARGRYRWADMVIHQRQRTSGGASAAACCRWGAAQITYEQARDLETINHYIAPALINIGKQVVDNFGATWAQLVLTNASLSQSIFSKSLQSLNPAIVFSVFNLRPFDPPAAIPSVTIGLICLIIVAFFSFGFLLPIHMKFVICAPRSRSSHRLFPQRGEGGLSVIVDNYSALVFKLVNPAADFERIIIEVGGGHNGLALVVGEGVGMLGSFDKGVADQWFRAIERCEMAVEVDDGNIQGFDILVDVDEDGPEQ
jgi:Protein of unknown function (DUF3533)